MDRPPVPSVRPVRPQIKLFEEKNRAKSRYFDINVLCQKSTDFGGKSPDITDFFLISRTFFGLYYGRDFFSKKKIVISKKKS